MSSLRYKIYIMQIFLRSTCNKTFFNTGERVYFNHTNLFRETFSSSEASVDTYFLQIITLVSTFLVLFFPDRYNFPTVMVYVNQYISFAKANSEYIRETQTLACSYKSSCFYKILDLENDRTHDLEDTILFHTFDFIIMNSSPVHLNCIAFQN